LTATNANGSATWRPAAPTNYVSAWAAIITPDRGLSDQFTIVVTNNCVLNVPTNSILSSLCNDGDRLRLKLAVTNSITTGFAVTLTNAYNVPLGSGISNVITLYSNSTAIVSLEKVGATAQQTNMQWLVESYMAFTNRY
jgi:hypothetical protein